MMKSKKDVFVSEKTANLIYDGIYKNDYSKWYKVGGKRYIPIDCVFGIEDARNKLLFYNFVDNNIYHILNIEIATLDSKEYFLHLKFSDRDEIFIPIR